MCQKILPEEVGMHSNTAKSVSRILTDDQIWQLVGVCTEPQQLASEDESFLSRVMTGDESFV